MTVVGPLGLTVRDQALEADVQAGLAAVEEGLFEATKSDVPFITGAAQHLVRAGGKRFRPLLVMLGAQFGDPHAPGVVPSAVVVELTHLATLYHDDVMDEADVRRGVPSANANWTNSVAVLTGDFLFARASHILADLGPEAVRIQAEAFERLVTGQILETAGPGDRDPAQHYLDVLAGKTGSLIAVACRFGALMSGAGERDVSILTQYGERIGTAFQLADDLLDIASDTHESGKTPGTDLREGVATLPVLHLRARAASPEGTAEDRALCDLLAGDLTDDARHAEALAGLRAHPALEQARQDTVRYAREARDALAPLSDCAAKTALSELCDAVVDRAV